MIIDAHIHLGGLAGFHVPDASAAAALALMDRLGIDMAINMPNAGLMECFEVAYASACAAYQESAGRLPFALTYHPRYPEDSLAAIEASLAGPGAVAIKIHPGQHQTYPNDPAYDVVWRLAAERSLPIITHSWALSDYNPTQRFAVPELYEPRIARFPQVNLVLGHSGGRYEGHLAAAALAQRYANVYLDLSGDVYSFGFIEWLTGQVGAERILFGTDLDWIDPRTHLGRVLDADISAHDKELILGANACRLFGLSTIQR